MLIDKKITDLLWTKYHARGHNNSPDNLGFGWIHYAMIRNLQPERVLCIGSQRGFVPAIMALACLHNGKGVVHFVDAGLDLKKPEDNQKAGEKSWGGVGLWKTVDGSYFDDLGVGDHIKLHVQKTEDFAEGLEEMHPGEKFDYIYIDGDHSLEGVKRDYELFFPMLKPMGFMTFHDIEVEKETDWGKCGVKEFWRDLMYKSEAEGMIELPFDCGLGIIQK